MRSRCHGEASKCTAPTINMAAPTRTLRNIEDKHADPKWATQGRSRSTKRAELLLVESASSERWIGKSFTREECDIVPVQNTIAKACVSGLELHSEFHFWEPFSQRCTGAFTGIVTSLRFVASYVWHLRLQFAKLAPRGAIHKAYYCDMQARSC